MRLISQPIISSTGAGNRSAELHLLLESDIFNPFQPPSARHHILAAVPTSRHLLQPSWPPQRTHPTQRSYIAHRTDTREGGTLQANPSPLLADYTSRTSTKMSNSPSSSSSCARSLANSATSSTLSPRRTTGLAVRLSSSTAPQKRPPTRSKP